jgi:hypothetical protein
MPMDMMRQGWSMGLFLGDLLEDELGSSLSQVARAILRVMLDMREEPDGRIAELDKRLFGKSVLGLLDGVTVWALAAWSCW